LEEIKISDGEADITEICFPLCLTMRPLEEPKSIIFNSCRSPMKNDEEDFWKRDKF
jgi:hypothetical protein